MLDPRYAESWITASVVWLQALKGVQWIYKGANVEGQKYWAISVLDNLPLRTPLLICWSVGYWQRQRPRRCYKSAYLMHDVCTLCMPYTYLFPFTTFCFAFSCERTTWNDKIWNSVKEVSEWRLTFSILFKFLICYCQPNYWAVYYYFTTYTSRQLFMQKSLVIYQLEFCPQAIFRFKVSSSDLSVDITKTIKVMYNQSIRIVLKMTVESNNEILIAIVTFRDWSKNIVPVFQPTRSKTNRALYARFFLRFFWKFWLVHRTVHSCCDWSV